VIHLAQPYLAGNEQAYVLDSLRRGQLSQGDAVRQFERSFARLCNVEYALACSSGTAALHLLLRALGVKPGDEVIVPDLTYVATANAVAYCGGKPVFADVSEEEWTLDSAQARQAVTPHTVGIVVVHLYGQPAKMNALRAIAAEHGLWVVEDAAEAVGARYMGEPAGSLGIGGAFSFYGNKIIATGEGGMVTTNDPVLAAEVEHLRGQGVDKAMPYTHTAVGYNYRMTELQAAVGLAQLEMLDGMLARRRQVAEWYKAHMDGCTYGNWRDPHETPDGTRRVDWLAVMVADWDPVAAAQFLAEWDVETRPVFVPLHKQPIYRVGANGKYPVADALHDYGLCLPLHPAMTEDDVRHVAAAVDAALDRALEGTL